MLSILDFAVATPARTETIWDIIDELALSHNQVRMFSRFFGLNGFRCDHAQPLGDLTADAIARVLDGNPGLESRLKYVAHCHTLLSTSPLSGVTSPVLQPFAQRGITVFSATMNHCATGISMLGLLGKLLRGDEVGLILIAEKAFHPALRLIENTTVMGEAAAAILVGPGSGRYEVLGTHTRHHTGFWLNSGRRGERYLDGFDAAYLDFACDGLLGALRKFGLGLGDVRYVLPHNVNLPSWQQIAERVGLTREQVWLGTIGSHGHCFGADPFLNLIDAAETKALSAADLVLLFSVGLGATASCALVRVC